MDITMNKLSARAAGAAALAVAAAFLLAAPLAGAQVGTFGSMVGLGDSDYVPLMKADTKRLGKLPADAGQSYTTIVRGDLGNPDDYHDDCWFVDTDISDLGNPVQDLRLTACEGKPAGSLATGTDYATQADRFETQPKEGIRLRLGDIVKGNGKLDKGEPVYLVYFADTDPATAAYDGTPPTTGIPSTDLTDDETDGVDGDWAIRLTPYLDFPAGSLVQTKDEDVDHFGSSALDLTDKLSIGEREDKGWYVVNSGKVTKNSPLPVKAIRLGPTGTPAIMPSVQPSSLQLPEEAPVAGGEYKVQVSFSNDGKAAGPGLLVTKVNGEIADVRLTAWLDPGQSSSTIVEVPLPAYGGPALLEVSGFKVTLDVEGPLPPAGADGAADGQAAALEARIADLEARLAAAGTAASATQSTASASRGSPGLGAALVLVAAGIALLIRRNAD